jgi:predicted ABC-type exoprotein transport system permease subunit
VDQEDSNEMHHAFQKFCLLLIILHGKLSEYQINQERIQNDFLKRLNVFEVIKGLKSLVEKRLYDPADIQQNFLNENS